MKRRLKRQLRTVLMSVVWVAVVVGAVVLALTRRNETGSGAVYLVAALAAVMLTALVINWLPAKVRQGRLRTLIGPVVTGALILLALAILGYSAYRSGGLSTGTVVLGVFFLIFLGIGRDFLKAKFGKDPKARRRSGRENGAAGPGARQITGDTSPGGRADDADGAARQ